MLYSSPPPRGEARSRYHGPIRERTWIKKIRAGEYELFNTLDSSQIISRAESEVLTPGMSITMAIIVGRYHSADFNRCPRPGYKSEIFISSESGGKTWYDSCWHRIPLKLKAYTLTKMKSNLQGLL